MNNFSSRSNPIGTLGSSDAAKLYLHAFWGLLLRDFRVLRRELGPFAVRVIMNPLLFLFVFTFLFPRIGEGFGVTSKAGDRTSAPFFSPA